MAELSHTALCCLQLVHFLVSVSILPFHSVGYYTVSGMALVDFATLY